MQDILIALGEPLLILTMISSGLGLLLAIVGKLSKKNNLCKIARRMSIVAIVSFATVSAIVAYLLTLNRSSSFDWSSFIIFLAIVLGAALITLLISKGVKKGEETVEQSASVPASAASIHKMKIDRKWLNIILPLAFVLMCVAFILLHLFDGSGMWYGVGATRIANRNARNSTWALWGIVFAIFPLLSLVFAANGKKIPAVIFSGINLLLSLFCGVSAFSRSWITGVGWVLFIIAGVLILLNALGYLKNKKLTVIFFVALSFISVVLFGLLAGSTFSRNSRGIDFVGVDLDRIIDVLRQYRHLNRGWLKGGSFAAYHPFSCAVLFATMGLASVCTFPKREKRRIAAVQFQQEKEKERFTSFDSAYCDMGKHILLLFLTLGVWYYIWIYRMTGYLNAVEDEEYRDPTKKLLLCIFVPFYAVYWIYKSAQRVDKLAAQKGVTSELSTLCLVLALFVGVVPPILIQDKVNAIIKHKPVATNPNTEATVDAQPVPETSKADGQIELLEKLAKLHEQGILTDEEFRQKKADLLAKM